MAGRDRGGEKTHVMARGLAWHTGETGGVDTPGNGQGRATLEAGGWAATRRLAWGRYAYDGGVVAGADACVLGAAVCCITGEAQGAPPPPSAAAGGATPGDTMAIMLERSAVAGGGLPAAGEGGGK